MANKITVTSAGTVVNANVTPDSAMYYSNKSKEWAISEKLIDNEDYSSKYYANESKKQADISTAKAAEVVESGNTAVSNIENARDNAITEITNQESLSIDNVNTAGATQISGVNTAGVTQVANVNSAGTTQVNLAKEQVTLATNQANIAKEQATIATNKTSEVVASGNEALSNIDTAKTGAITDITDLKNTSVSNITTAKNSAITTITTQETTSKNNVIATGNEQVERVNLAGIDNKTPIFTKSEIGANEGVYQNVYDLKHSTFDLSKFTVVGSPTITDDGIASGLSDKNYIKASITPISSTSTFEIKIKFKLSEIPSTWTKIWGIGQGGYSQVYITSRSIDFNWPINGTNYTSSILFSFTGIEDVTYIFGWNGTQIYSRANINGLDYTGSSVSLATSIGFSGIYFANVGFTEAAFTGSIDLKYFSITVDGKEVFSGNKTGIDVIKPDNYEVVGSPTITDEGVLQGTNAGIALVVSNIPQSNNELEISFDYIYKKRSGFVFPVIIDCLDKDNNHLFAIGITANENRLSFGGNNKFLVVDTRYKFKIKTDLKTYRSLYIDNVLLGTVNIETPMANVTRIYIGNYYSALNDRWDGSYYDLNAFKIYVDGNLVYQSCLKIPCTQSKTGSKIVDEVYRDRVIDLYEQEGQAGYYTIDEENKNFTLPMGEIYGMIGQRSLISSTVTETNRVDIYSDKTCLICGNVATAGTINLPIELVSNNYFITLSTSAKTATSFTTTATGDYILIGKVI